MMASKKSITIKFVHQCYQLCRVSEEQAPYLVSLGQEKAGCCARNSSYAEEKENQEDEQDVGEERQRKPQRKEVAKTSLFVKGVQSARG